MTTLRRGFKSEANSYAREFRRELDLRAFEPLCPWRLAKHLEVPIMPISSLKRFSPDAVEYLMTVGRVSFSAVTIGFGRHGSRRLILHNDGSAKSRQAADVAHELSHVILGHELALLFSGPDNSDDSKRVEAEAKWMGPALLVSEEAAIHVVRTRMTIAAAASEYAVSPSLLQMRINVTGAKRRIKAWSRP